MKANSDFGKVVITLDEVIKERGLSKSKVAFRAEIYRQQLNNYISGNIQRLDMSLLARLCYALDCSLSDIVKYVPPEEG